MAFTRTDIVDHIEREMDATVSKLSLEYPNLDSNVIFGHAMLAIWRKRIALMTRDEALHATRGQMVMFDREKHSVS